MFDSKKFKLKFLQRVNPYRFISMINDNEPIQEKFQNVSINFHAFRYKSKMARQKLL